ncbi:DNA/RNA non-specific endonuclease [Ferrovibrio sp.]|uniref:DNA/RNA non-specific endonuclease n=1 Tax=Ferrovibrio sp. TaxID=1917215 RepID=UPI00345BF677
MLLAPSYAHADINCLQECPIGSPAHNTLLSRPTHTLSNNPETKFSDWVAYRVNPKNFGRGQRRNWQRDPDLAEDSTLAPADYKGIGTNLRADRGHQAPLASFSANAEWYKTNYLSNITPQYKQLNRGPWKHLEDAERKFAMNNKKIALYVVTGPLYERHMPPLPNAKKPHRVPSGYWKFIGFQEGTQVSWASFVFDQRTKSSGRYCDHLESLKSLEQRAGLSVLSVDVPDHMRRLPSTTDLAKGLGCK